MYIEYLTEGALLDTNLVVMFFLSLFSVHIFRNDNAVRTPGTSLVCDSFINCEHHRKQEPDLVVSTPL